MKRPRPAFFIWGNHGPYLWMRYPWLFYAWSIWNTPNVNQKCTMEYVDYQSIIDKYYPEDNALRRLFLRHSRDVADRALAICDRHPELSLDRRFVEEGAMLHDLGIFKTDAPGIHCCGTDPYILHGYDGGLLLRAEGLPRHARVCERHTGAGITLRQIEEQHLPLPHQDFLPETLEEQVICYADKFYSKSHPERVKTIEEAERSVAKHGADGLERFREWERMFE